MRADEILSIWIGGPLDGAQRTDPRRDVEKYLAQTIVCIALGRAALYRFDEQITEGRLYLRFVRQIARQTTS